MVNQQVLQGNWNEIKGKIRSHWGQLTEEDLPQFHGEVDKLVGTIQRKTGEGRDAIEKYLTELSSGAASSISQAAETVRQYSHRASEGAQQTAKQAMEQVRSGYDQAQHFVQERPAQSLAMCFGAGLVSGVLVALMLRSK